MEKKTKQLRDRLYDLGLLALTLTGVTLAVYIAPQGDVISAAIFALGVTVGLGIGWRKD